MKINVMKSNLIKGINIVLKAIPTRTTMNILDCIYVNAQGDRIIFTTTNQELTIETSIEGEIIEKGAVCLEAKILSEIVRKLPDNHILIQVDENDKTTIRCEKTKFNIHGKSKDEFPKVKMLDKQDPISISQYTLKEIIRQTIFSISNNESNKLMTGELFELNNKELILVALDGHRISMRKTELDKDYQPIRVIVPGKSLDEISKILSGEMEDNVNIYINGNHILFEMENTMVLSRLLEGEYYKLSQILSNNYETVITVNKKDFYNCIDRSILFMKEGEKNPLVMELEDSKMKLSISSSIGSMDEEIDVSKEGQNIRIGFNSKYLNDALKVIDDEEIKIYFSNAKAPCFIKNDDETYTYLILPINIH